MLPFFSIIFWCLKTMWFAVILSESMNIKPHILEEGYVYKHQNGDEMKLYVSEKHLNMRWNKQRGCTFAFVIQRYCPLPLKGFFQHISSEPCLSRDQSRSGTVSQFLLQVPDLVSLRGFSLSVFLTTTAHLAFPAPSLFFQFAFSIEFPPCLEWKPSHSYLHSRNVKPK